MPTFRSSCYIAAPTFTNFGKSLGTSKHFDSSAAFLFEVPGSNSPPALQELQIGGARPVEFCSIAGVPGEAERKAVARADVDLPQGACQGGRLLLSGCSGRANALFVLQRFMSNCSYADRCPEQLLPRSNRCRASSLTALA